MTRIIPLMQIKGGFENQSKLLESQIIEQGFYDSNLAFGVAVIVEIGTTVSNDHIKPYTRPCISLIVKNA